MRLLSILVGGRLNRVAILTEITGVTMRVAVLASGGKDSLMPHGGHNYRDGKLFR